MAADLASEGMTARGFAADYAIGELEFAEPAEREPVAEGCGVHPEAVRIGAVPVMGGQGAVRGGP
ncbi:hypothetical protein GCM10022403_079740 [Streptomyces coacervatus]|uniref:Uncharacterized protein n=1 Tax=Streptomyces coacervatus TaxID=647381 RepID=A0ABP7J523_9ACTN